MTDSAQSLRKAVKVFIERREISPSRIGRLLFGNPSFVAALLRGCSPRLDTADRVLEFIGLAPIGPRFRCEVEAYLAVTGSKPTAVGEAALQNRSFVRRLRDGSSPHLETVDRMRLYMRRTASPEEWRMIEAAAVGSSRDDAMAARNAAAEPAEKPPPPAAGAAPLYWTTRELAAVLRLSRSTLARYRWSGGGPKFLKTRGRVLYARAHVEEWLARRERSSTSDSGRSDPDTPPCSADTPEASSSSTEDEQ